MLCTTLDTAFAATGTALLTSALFSLGRSTRTFQNAINGPLYLLGGVLVPATLLPFWIQPISLLVFFYWAANLMRASLQIQPADNIILSLAMIFILGSFAGAIGAVVLRIMLSRLRLEGRLGLR
jgi:ABC-2 type transport system permease protein